MLLNLLPPLIFKFLLFSICVFAQPWLKFEEWHQNARNVVIFHHLVNNGHRQRLHVIRNEPDQAEAAHRACEFNFVELFVKFFAGVLFCKQVTCGDFLVGHQILAVGQIFAPMSHVCEFSIAVVN